MEQYYVKKVLNNNVIIAICNCEEMILVGKGIGYNVKKGSQVANSKIENIFINKDDAINKNYGNLLKIIDNNIVGISEEIIHMCEKKLKLKFNESIHVSLPDHINFAIRRLEKGVKIENPFLQEMKVLFVNEYNLAEQALELINERLNVNLPKDEIGFITLHIRASINSTEVGQTFDYTRKIGEIMQLISKLLKKKFVKNSLEYARTVTHINFMVERIKNNKPIKNYLLENIKKEMYNEYDIGIKVAIKMEQLFSISVPEDEIGYIALHLRRLTEI